MRFLVTANGKDDAIFLASRGEWVSDKGRAKRFDAQEAKLQLGIQEDCFRDTSCVQNLRIVPA